jgi:hypothetical protein
LEESLERIVEQLEEEPLLLNPSELRCRLDALDLLDAYFPNSFRSDSNAQSNVVELYRRADTIRSKLETLNSDWYEGVRREIQKGGGRGALLRWAGELGDCDGMGYDYLDELISGVLQIEEPAGVGAQGDPETVFYQPTPARHIFSLMEQTALTEDDVLVDLGSGLGHVPLLVSICSGARCVGIELEAAYVERARECARKLNLDRVSFVQQDAREADLSAGTVFFLYTPFTGSILNRVLANLRREAPRRRIRICTFGPCTTAVGEEPWLETLSAQEIDRVVVFHSR